MHASESAHGRCWCHYNAHTCCAVDMTRLNTLQSAGEVQCGKQNRTRLHLFLESFLLEGLRSFRKG